MQFRKFLSLTALAASFCFILALAIGARADDVRPVSFQCSIGASIGVANVAHDVASLADIGSAAFNVSPEVGCTYRATTLSHGLVLRYDFNRADSEIMGVSVRETDRIMALYRLGFDINAGAHMYVLAGAAWTNIKVPEAGLKDATNGLVLGAGLDLDIGKGPFSAFAEYNHIKWSGADLDGTTVKTDDNIVRAGVRYHFGR